MSDAGKARDLPWAVFVEAGVSVRWCGCGRPAAGPCCDCRLGQDASSPVVLVATRSQWLWLCGCSRSASLPFCDGSHRRPVAR